MTAEPALTAGCSDVQAAHVGQSAVATPALIPVG